MLKHPSAYNVEGVNKMANRFFKKVGLMLSCLAVTLWVGCGNSPTQPEYSTTTRIGERDAYERFDTDDAPYTKATEEHLAEIQKAFPMITLIPDTMSYQGFPYFLGSIVTKRGVELIERTERSTTFRETRDIPFNETDLQRRLNQAATGASERTYLPLGAKHVGHIARAIIDVPDVPQTRDIDERLQKMNQRNAGDIRFVPVYLRPEDGSLPTSPTGDRIIDGMEIVPLQSSAGYTGMVNHARYIATGETHWLTP